METIQGAPPPPSHQTAGNVGNANPLILASSRGRMGGYGKIVAVDPTESNKGIFHPSFFVIFFSDDDATYLSANNPPCR